MCHFDDFGRSSAWTIVGESPCGYPQGWLSSSRRRARGLAARSSLSDGERVTMLRSIPDDDWEHRRESDATVPIVGYFPDFGVTCRPEGEDLVVRVSGDVDLCTAPMLWEAIEQALRSPSAGVIIDLEQLRFIDASGLAMLVR